MKCLSRLLTPLCVLFFMAGPILLLAQGGKMYFTDVDAFNQPGPNQGVVKYLRCGNDNSLNPPSALTMEAWIKPSIPTDNQKIMGKVDANAGAIFNDGYLLGIDNSRLAPEIWTPNNNSFQEGFIPPVSAWHHVAITFEVDGSYNAYLNGEQVYQTGASDQNIVHDNTNFIIGIAPWDLASFMFFGNLDEVRLWNVARTGTQIRQSMYRNLTGNEPGLVLYINFDNEDGSNVIPDLSSKGNDCTKVNFNTENIQSSTCIIADAETQAQQDLNAIWFSSSALLQDPRSVSTANGLSLSTFFNGQDSSAYVVWGHDGGAGLSSADLPADAPSNTQRLQRIWRTTRFGTIKPSFVFDLEAASGGGTLLPSDKPANFYTLLERKETTGAFTAVAHAVSKEGTKLRFDWVPLQSSYYTLAVGNEAFDVVGTKELAATAVQLSVYPNPNQGQFELRVEAPKAKQIMGTIFSASGQLIWTGVLMEGANTVTLPAHLSSGLYLLRVQTDRWAQNQSFVILP